MGQEEHVHERPIGYQSEEELSPGPFRAGVVCLCHGIYLICRILHRTSKCKYNKDSVDANAEDRQLGDEELRSHHTTQQEKGNDEQLTLCTVSREIERWKEVDK